MNCTVYTSKLYSAAMLVLLAALAAMFAWFFRHGSVPFVFKGVTALFLGAGTTALIYSLVTNKPVVTIDETGIYYRRSLYKAIAWSDVVAIERLPKVRRTSDGYQSCLRDAWRPLRLTVRNPDKYLHKFQQTGRRVLASMVKDPDHIQLEIEFMGLTPGSDVVEHCIRQHLARLGKPSGPFAGSGL